MPLGLWSPHPRLGTAAGEYLPWSSWVGERPAGTDTFYPRRQEMAPDHSCYVSSEKQVGDPSRLLLGLSVLGTLLH